MKIIDTDALITGIKSATGILDSTRSSITNSVSDVIASPCRPVMGGVYSVNSAKVCHCPSIGVGPLMDGLLRTTRLRPVYALPCSTLATPQALW